MIMKTKLIYILLFLSVFSSGLLFAQNDKQAEQIVADFVKSVEQSAIQTDFTLTISDENGLPAQKQNGTFFIKNNKFLLMLEDVQVFFDGKTQWSYVFSNNEVSITEPSEDELAEINPIFILREYQNKSAIHFSADGKSAENYTIEMLPIIKADFDKIEVRLNKSTRNLLSMKLLGGNMSVQISFSNFQHGANIPDSRFIFNKSQYKDVFENDLR